MGNQVKKESIRGGKKMAKKTRGYRMREAKKRATKHKGGKGPVRGRPAGKKIMKH